MQTKLRRIKYSNAQLAMQFLLTLYVMKGGTSNEVEVITDEPKGCCDWAMDTTS
jgi:hypothetical protein